MTRQVLPIGESDFTKIRERNYLYVDKTEHIFRVISGSTPNFLSRPRRFGKSLLVSTMEQLFLGNKELFKGLWIYDKIDWQPRPVIRLSMTEIDYKNQDLEIALSQYLDRIAEGNNIGLQRKTSKEKLAELIKALATEQRVAVLIDEYDKPIIDFIEDFKQATINRDILRNFYGALKDGVVDTHVHFLFITGISKFSKTSIFSELNNPRDLTIDPLSVDLCGVTQKELEGYFASYISEVATALELQEKTLLKELKRWYNGYSWDGKTFVYNPFSLLNFFSKGEFGNFWFASGTPTLLLKVIKKQKIDVEKVGMVKWSSHSFESFTLEKLDFNNLLFQTGYLTIKKKTLRKGRPTYTLGFPNQEVQQSLTQNLIMLQSNLARTAVDQSLLLMEDALEDNDIEAFIEQLKVLFSDIAYQLHPKLNKKNPTDEDKTKLFKAWEGYFHSIIYLVIKFLGIHIDVEMSKHKGRIDAKIEVDDYLYIMEFKLDASAEKAMEQIKTQKYADAFQNASKQVVLVGVSFDSKECNVGGWRVEEL